MPPSLPPLPDGFEYRLELRHHVTPRLLKEQPVHRWFWFPHSYSPHLIDEVLRVFPLPTNGCILDPFVGAGTTVLRARELGYPAVGSDLSPLSLFVSKAKLATYDPQELPKGLQHVLAYRPACEDEVMPERLRKAFTDDELAHLSGLRQRIEALPQPMADFFRLALLRVQQQISRARPDGGWFRWIKKEDQSEAMAGLFYEQAQLQIADVSRQSGTKSGAVACRVVCSDARNLASLAETFDLVITSPPYPNRHDYSRIFHIEMLSLGFAESEVANLRHGSIRSHVEAAAPAESIEGYTMPQGLRLVLERLPADADPRIAPMLKGYFEDMHLTLKALWPRLRAGGVCAFVVGNVRHTGVMVPVDEILVEIGQELGYRFLRAWVARLRGNSAQQMGRYGREAARETVVLLRR